MAAMRMRNAGGARRFAAAVVLFLLFALFPGAARAAESDAYIVSALVSLASYSDETGLLVRRWLKETNWTLRSSSAELGKTEGRVHLATKTLQDGRKALFLAFPGTENRKDLAVDLRLSLVPFGGTNPEEFAAFAAAADQAEDVPRVHKGFNDFTMAALFSERLEAHGGRTTGEMLADELKEHPEETLYLTGHSLGGAAALLTAARLADLGVPAEQLHVITFGAPAVGDERFARLYENRLHLTRIVMTDDPVAGILQSVTRHFVQFGDKIVWQRASKEDRFGHELALYFDEALRRYYNAEKATEDVHDFLRGEPQEVEGGIYVAPSVFTLPKELAADAPYIDRAVHDSLAIRCRPLVFAADDAPKDRAALLAEARAAGCRYLLMERFEVKFLRKEYNSYRLTLEEAVYASDGTLRSLSSRSTNTRRLPAIEGFLYLAYKGSEERDKALGL